VAFSADLPPVVNSNQPQFIWAGPTWAVGKMGVAMTEFL
jgi:hypothetical protein